MSTASPSTPSPRVATNRSMRLQGSQVRKIYGPTIAVVLGIALAMSSSAAIAQDDASKGERQKKMAERRAERQQQAKELREKRNNPEYIKENAWWNEESNVTALKLTKAQRTKADTALLSFLEQRSSRQEEARQAQQAFFKALESNASDLQQKKTAMADAMQASTLANADLRIAVFSSLSAEQRNTISKEMGRLLRSNWADPRQPRERMQRRGQTQRGNRSMSAGTPQNDDPPR